VGKHPGNQAHPWGCAARPEAALATLAAVVGSGDGNDSNGRATPVVSGSSEARGHRGGGGGGGVAAG
jgi:hypothetical protein